MEQYSENDILNIYEDWGNDSRNNLPYSNRAVQQFIKEQILLTKSEVGDKIGWLTMDGSNIIFLDKQDGTELGALTLSGQIYAINLDIV